MAILNNDRRPYAMRDDEGDDYGERRGGGYDRASYDRYGSDPDWRRYGRDDDRREAGSGRSWQRGRDHDERHGDTGGGWSGGPDDGDREREYGGGTYGMGRYGSRSQGSRSSGGAYGDDDAYAGGPVSRGSDFDRDVGSRQGGIGRGWYGGGHDWYGGEHSRGGGARAGLRSGGPGSGSYREGSVAMGMGAGIEGPASMAGKGPKGYVRSDDRIREDVCDCLTDDPHLDASSIEVQVRNGEVTLTGTVDSRGAKRHAEDLAERASGVKDVQNSLRVQAGSEAAGKKADRSGG